MKEKYKSIGYVLLLAAGLLLFWQSYGLWQERASLGEQRQALQQDLSVIKQFAAAHKDYDAYERGLQVQRTKLERELSGRSSSAECLKLVQRLAAEQGVRVKSVQNLQMETDVGEKRNVTQLKLVAEGDYFSALRWLRKLEREGVTISELRVQKEKLSTENLQLELLVKLHEANL